jgi:hypothetical protein
MYGPHAGVGRLAVADWWLAMGFAVLGVVAAAAAPAAITVRAKMRMASFILVTSDGFELAGSTSPVHQNPKRFRRLSPANSEI